MPVPKRRTSKRVKNQRRAHDGLTKPQWSTCANCGETVCPTALARTAAFIAAAPSFKLKKAD